jgi:hypothetical protein
VLTNCDSARLSTALHPSSAAQHIHTINRINCAPAPVAFGRPCYTTLDSNSVSTSMGHAMTQKSPLVRFGPRGAGPATTETRILRAGRPNTPFGSAPVGNNGNAEAVALHAKRSASFDLGNSDGIQRFNRLSSAYASDATGSSPARNATGCAPTQSMTQQGTTAPQGGGHRPASGAARRQTGEIRRRALPAHRS